MVVSNVHQQKMTTKGLRPLNRGATEDLSGYPGRINSKPRLLNLILLNLIVRWPTDRSHYINNLWNVTFDL